jgi:hypothetical protein
MKNPTSNPANNTFIKKIIIAFALAIAGAAFAANVTVSTAIDTFMQSATSQAALSNLTSGNHANGLAYITLTNGMPISNISGETSIVIGSDTTTAPTLTIDGVTANNRDLRFETAGSLRWVWRVNNTAETGSDAGSDLQLIARTDTGTAIDVPFSFVRAAGGAFSTARPFVGAAGELITGAWSGSTTDGLGHDYSSPHGRIWVGGSDDLQFLIGGPPGTGTVYGTLASTGFTTPQFTSTVSTGTAPLVVSSTTQVANLNAATAGTAANLSGTPALPNGTTATTQAALDKSTNLATTAYVDGIIAPVTISASDIDWSLVAQGGVCTKTLAANTTFTFSNLTSGKKIVVVLTNTASNYTVTWPTVSWPNGITPVMTTGVHTDIYTFVDIGGTIYGSYVQNY